MRHTSQNARKHRRRLTAVIGTVLALVASLALTGSPGGGSRGETDNAVPGGYASWSALLAVQRQMNSVAQLMQEVPGQSRSSGYSGAVAAPERHALVLYWHGSLSRKARAVLAKSPVPVQVRPAARTAAEAQADADRILDTVRRTPRNTVTSVVVPPDGGSIKITIKGTRADAARLRPLLKDTALPVTIATGGTSAQQLSSRWNDPTAGGASMGAPVCSLGFSIFRNGQMQMLTAQHCFDAGGTDRYSIDDDGQVGEWLGSLDSRPAVNRGVTMDVAAIRRASGIASTSDNSFGPQIWRGLHGDPTGDGQYKTSVSDAAVPQVGNWVCTSGARSGEICNIQVIERVDAYRAEGISGGVVYGSGWVGKQRTRGKPAAGKGDSGGPVYLDNQESPGSGPSGGVTAVGIISSGFGRQTPCQGVPNPNRPCFSNIHFTGIDDAIRAVKADGIVTDSGQVKSFPADGTATDNSRLHDELRRRTAAEEDSAPGVDASNNTQAEDRSTAKAQHAVRYVDVATGLCLDSNTDGHVYTLGCNGAANQQWHVQKNSTGGAELKDVATGLCLDSNTDGQVYTLGCNGGTNQRWQVRDTGGQAVEWKNEATGLCLDSNADRDVYTLNCNQSDNQRWRA